MPKLKLFKRDVLIAPVDTSVVEKSIVYVKREDENKKKLNYFEVLDVSSQVTMVKPGDIILLEYMKHTLVMEWNNKMCAITSEDEISAVIDK